MSAKLPIRYAAIRDFCRAHAIRELALFGSVLREDFRDDSDVDVLIDLAPSARIGLVGLQQMRDELARIFGQPVDLLTRAVTFHLLDQSW